MCCPSSSVRQGRWSEPLGGGGSPGYVPASIQSSCDLGPFGANFEGISCRSAPVSTAHRPPIRRDRHTQALRLRDMYASARPRATADKARAERQPLRPFDLARGSRQAQVPQPYVPDPVEELPGCVAVALIAHHQRIASIKLLIEHVAAGKLGPDQVPGELVELVTFGRRDRGRLPPALESVAEVGLCKHVDRGR